MFFQAEISVFQRTFFFLAGFFLVQRSASPTVRLGANGEIENRAKVRDVLFFFGSEDVRQYSSFHPVMSGLCLWGQVLLVNEASAWARGGVVLHVHAWL